MPGKKWLREFTLNVGKGRNHQFNYRDAPSLLDPNPRRVVEFKRGVPIFSRAVDTIQNFATGNRQYKPRVVNAPLVTDFDSSNFHEMKGKFKFHISGRFPNGAVEFEKEIHHVASDLFLVGFLKVRSRYAMGHLQGDVYALSYMRKWMEDRYNESGTIDSVQVFDDSYGIPEFRYKKLECIKDWRSPVRRRQHMAAIQEQEMITKLEQRSRQKNSEEELFASENHVRTF